MAAELGGGSDDDVLDVAAEVVDFADYAGALPALEFSLVFVEGNWGDEEDFVDEGEFDGGFGFAKVDRCGAVLGGEAAKSCLDEPSFVTCHPHFVVV